MKNFWLTLLLIFLYSSQLAAQVNYKDGYIVTLDSDTVYGKILVENTLKNKSRCQFSDGSTITVYDPSEIKGYGFLKDSYFASGIVDERFVQVLISGDLSLYKYGNELYLQKEGFKLLKLARSEIHDTIEGRVYIREDLTWRGYVTLMIHDCIQDPRVIRKLTIDEGNISMLVLDYNKCKGTSYVDHLAAKQWFKAELGIESELTRSSIGIKKLTAVYDYLPDKFVSYEPSFGLIFLLSSPRLRSRLAFQSEIEFIRSDLFSEVILQKMFYTTYNNTYIRLSTLSFPESIRYTVIDRKYKLMINVGMLFAYNLHQETRLESQLVRGHDVFNNSEQSFSIRNKRIGFCSGIGIQKSFEKFNAGFNLKFNRMNNFSILDYDMKSSLNRLSISLVLSTK